MPVVDTLGAITRVPAFVLVLEAKEVTEMIAGIMMMTIALLVELC